MTHHIRIDNVFEYRGENSQNDFNIHLKGIIAIDRMTLDARI